MDCSRRCYCDDGQLSCDFNYQCSPNAVCEERNNVRQCYCNNGYEGNGVTCSIITRKDCLDLFNSGVTTSGIYSIEPDSWDGGAFNVYCNMTDGGGWTVFQRRLNGAVDFQRNWGVYKVGFGPQDGEHWLGNDKLFSLTNQRRYELRIDLVDSVGDPYFAKYDFFRINDETNNYALAVRSYIDGDAGDSLTARHNGEDFSTIDRDNDDMADFHLANTTAGPWWYGGTAESSLNANYDSGIIRWLSLPGFHGRIRFVEMKVRPV
ncbi:Ryncolin-4 [Holothuria leucospilota]|uniref:Ryncolin-4 n=1 Tax=Holothuria leucospilota TaxID=206669 RepID=A0A9Q1H5S9_HOLLE|nr:Ryncolin-4 [Holothuria leucospilota]